MDLNTPVVIAVEATGSSTVTPRPHWGDPSFGPRSYAGETDAGEAVATDAAGFAEHWEHWTLVTQTAEQTRDLKLNGGFAGVCPVLDTQEEVPSSDR